MTDYPLAPSLRKPTQSYLRQKKTGVARQAQRLGRWATDDHPQYSPCSATSPVATAAAIASAAWAASKIQGSFRRRGKAGCAAVKGSVDKASCSARECIDENAKLAKGRMLNAIIAKGLTGIIKSAVANDPWIPKWVAKAVSPPLIAVIHEAPLQYH